MQARESTRNVIDPVIDVRGVFQRGTAGLHASIILAQAITATWGCHARSASVTSYCSEEAITWIWLSKTTHNAAFQQ
eukprot:1159789-Pelagomonas_calceolata.AAC.5